MSAQIYPSIGGSQPYFELIIENHPTHVMAVWICYDGEWWVTPNSIPGSMLLPIPIRSGVRLEWRALSGSAIARYNLVHGTDFSTQSEEIALNDDVAYWQGELYCTFVMLGRSMKLVLY